MFFYAKPKTRSVRWCETRVNDVYKAKADLNWMRTDSYTLSVCGLQYHAEPVLAVVAQ